FRRAGIPILYSQGFHPHPKISFSPPPPLGIFSSAEYLDVQFEPMPVEKAFQQLQESLPPDLLLLEHKLLFGKYQSLTSVVNRIDYSVIFPAEVDDNLIEDLICQFHSSPEFLIERERKGKRKTIDLKHYVPALSIKRATGQLKIITRMDDGKTVRMDEILTHILHLSTEQKAKCEITKDEMYIEFGQLRKTPIEI
ncbi:TIGR03936 family radical SAM-associated protein, partial [bacterium]|nr:TIGR03936 family radical SAM-associated protein [bacterium]